MATPSRVGRLCDLLALYDACELCGYRMYSGGIGERERVTASSP